MEVSDQSGADARRTLIYQMDPPFDVDSFWQRAIVFTTSEFANQEQKNEFILPLHLDIMATKKTKMKLK